MKKHNLLFVIACLVLANINAQILKKTFYDLKGSKPKEVFFVNANGEKNGNYKSYYDDGLVSVEANYKNGVLDGIYKEYQWLGSKAPIKLFITYKNGVKNGNSIYYGGENYTVKSSQGNYINDKKEGLWKVIEETSSTMPEGFRYFTYNRTYKDDKVVEESQTWFYYPSNKVFAETKNGVRTSFSPNGKKTGEETFNSNGEVIEEKFYYLNGAVAECNKTYMEQNQPVKEKSTWYENGKVKTNKVYISNKLVLLEAYKIDGTKEEEMLRFEKEHN